MKHQSPSALLAEKMIGTFAAPPVRAGMRLHPERELAQRLNVTPKCINRALHLLTERGILSKRHGSGNYIRRIPVPADAPAFPPEQLFPASEFREEVSPLASLPEQQKLTIQLWSGFHHNTGANENYSLYCRIREYVENAGHRLEEHDLVNPHWVPRTEQEIAGELTDCPADGYLVSAPLSGLFRQAAERAFGTQPDAVVYLSTWGEKELNEPEIRLDGAEALLRGIRRFAKENLRRIAFLGIQNTYHNWLLDRRIYEFALLDCELPYTMSRHVAPEFAASRDAVLQMLDAKEPPQALFIADDLLLPGAAEAFRLRGIVPGNNLAVICVTHSDDKNRIPCEWTAIDFNRELTGVMAAGELLKHLSEAGHELRSISMLGKWQFRGTHTLDGKANR